MCGNIHNFNGEIIDFDNLTNDDLTWIFSNGDFLSDHIWSCDISIFVVGCTGSGKSTTASFISEKIGTGRNGHIESSKWVSNEHDDTKDWSKRERANILSKRAKERLEKDPYACVNYIRGKMTSGPNVICGLRNPDDFMKIFNPNTDIVIYVQRDGFNPINDFEKGIYNIVDETSKHMYDERDLPVFWGLKL